MQAVCSQIISALLPGFAGLVLFIYIVNRQRRRMRLRGPVLLMFALSAMLLVVGGAAAAGLMLGPGPWLLGPALIVLSALFLEIQSRRLRARYRADLPVETHNIGLSLARPVTTWDVGLARYEVYLPNSQLTRLRVAVLSDLHVGKAIEPDYYAGIFDAINRFSPDLMALPGDFVANAAALPLLDSVLELCKARLGVFAVRGNHDFWSNATGVANALEKAGIRLLKNESARIWHGDAEIIITGCEDPWSKQTWQPPLRKSGEVVLALAHTADTIYKLSQHKIDAVFCGHYHAGQARLPGWGSVFVPSRYGRRFDHGHFLVNNTHLFVTAGIGASGPVLRIYCQPDVFIVDFLGTNNALFE